MIQMACLWGPMALCMPSTRYAQMPAAVLLGDS